MTGKTANVSIEHHGDGKEATKETRRKILNDSKRNTSLDNARRTLKESGFDEVRDTK